MAKLTWRGRPVPDYMGRDVWLFGRCYWWLPHIDTGELTLIHRPDWADKIEVLR